MVKIGAMSDVFKNEAVELRLGKWQTALADVGHVDAVITDPPYSPQTHSGFRSGSEYAAHRAAAKNANAYSSGPGVGGLPYAPASQHIADEAVRFFATASWHVVFGDHVSFGWWEEAARTCDRYVFAPVIWDRGFGCRFQGDGPCSAAEYICVSRPKRTTKIGSLPGIYRYLPEGGTSPNKVLRGQKPIDLMRALIRDYTDPGDLVCDPFAGSGTTLLAAMLEGRRAIGSEMDATTYAAAVDRLRGVGPRLTKTGQRNLFLSESGSVREEEGSDESSCAPVHDTGGTHG